MASLLVAFVLAAPRVLFVHQDVGQTVVDGVSVLSHQQAVPFTLEAVALPKSDPRAKLAAFVAEVDRLKPDVALLELGWSDVTATTDVDAMWKLVERTFADVAARKVRLLVCTVPLTWVGHGLQAAVKTRVTGAAFGERENLKRHQLNEKLRARYPGQLFDLAKVQAGACSFTLEKQTWPCADEALTEDGARLNAKGRKAAALALVAAVAGQ